MYFFFYNRNILLRHVNLGHMKHILVHCRQCLQALAPRLFSYYPGIVIYSSHNTHKLRHSPRPSKIFLK